MKILVIGATGALGREIVALAVALSKSQSIEVAALARDPQSLADIQGVEVLKGDVFDVESLKRAMAGVDAVISAFGLKLTRKPTLQLSDGTRNMVKAMNESRVKRFICVTGNGAGDSRGHGGFLFDRLLEPLLLREMYKDKTRQEAVIRESGLDWTIVRPAILTNGPRTSQYRSVVELSGMTASKISRADVSDFIIKELKDGKYRSRCVTLTY